jgi:hypothetical protein
MGLTARHHAAADITDRCTFQVSAMRVVDYRIKEAWATADQALWQRVSLPHPLVRQGLKNSTKSHYI